MEPRHTTNLPEYLQEGSPGRVRNKSLQEASVTVNNDGEICLKNIFNIYIKGGIQDPSGAADPREEAVSKLQSPRTKLEAVGERSLPRTPTDPAGLGSCPSSAYGNQRASRRIPNMLWGLGVEKKDGGQQRVKDPVWDRVSIHGHQGAPWWLGAPSPSWPRGL